MRNRITERAKVLARLLNLPRPGLPKFDAAGCARLTGWRARVELNEGLRRTVDWARGKGEAGQSSKYQ